MYNPECWMWRLADGRVWSTEAADFVDDGIAAAWAAQRELDAIPPSPVDGHGEQSEAGLRDALLFYGLPLGSLQSVDAIIAAKSAAIQAEKCRVRDAGFLVDGVLYDSDQAARLAYMEFALSLAQDASYTQQNWKASEGVWVTMDALQFSKVKRAGETALAAAFDWQKARDAELAAIKAAVAAGSMTEADARPAVAAVSATCPASEATAS